MKNLMKTCSGVLLLLLIGVPYASADVQLTDWAFNVDGFAYVNPNFSSYAPPAPGFLPAGFNTSGFDWSTGLGTIVFTFSPGVIGNYFFTAFLDFELSRDTNTPHNEYGDYPLPPSQFNPDGRVPAAGQTWQIGDPFTSLIWFNATGAGNDLDNTNTRTSNSPGDTALALGWSFSITDPALAAVITLSTSPNGPPSNGFYLGQFDNLALSTGAPGTDSKVFFSSTIEGAANPVIPEPGSVILLATVLAGTAVVLRRRLG